MKGGVKFYRAGAAAARHYVEADRSRVDDYYLAEGVGLAAHYTATPTSLPASESASLEGEGPHVPAVQRVGTLDGDAYERWVAGYDTEGAAKGRLRTDEHGLRFVEVTVNGPKTWSLAAAVDPEIAAAYDVAQERAAEEIIGWLADHMTTRVGPRGRQVQVPVEQLEAAVVRHYTSRAGDPHRHLHLQINARVYADGGWRGIHSVGVVDSIEAINGIGHAAVACDPGFRAALAAKGYTPDPVTAEVTQLAPYAATFSARAGQITRNIDRYEAAWRAEHPGEEPGRRLRQVWDRRAWAQARPDKVIPADGEQLERRWVEELLELGFVPPSPAATVPAHHAPWLVPLGAPIGGLDREAAAELVLVRLGGRRSGWNAADIRGEVEKIIVAHGTFTTGQVRGELAEDLVARAVAMCVPLLPGRDDVPEHVRAFTSPRVLAVEADLVAELSSLGDTGRGWLPGTLTDYLHDHRLDRAQAEVVMACATHQMVVVEGAAGTGKTATLAATKQLLQRVQRQRMMVVTPTLKAAQVAAGQVGAVAFSAAWLIHQHGYRWDADGNWTRKNALDYQVTAASWNNARSSGHIYHPYETGEVIEAARLKKGDLLVIDEAGMLDQDTALALLTIASEAGARVAFFGDRHQLPAVGRGGVLDHAHRWADPRAVLSLDTVHRFSDPDYANLTLAMRSGEASGEVFDALLARGDIVIHPTALERHAALTSLAAAGTATDHGEVRVIGQTLEQVHALNHSIRDHRITTGDVDPTATLTTVHGDQISVGDTIATRRNDKNLDVANRDTWTVIGIHGIPGSQRFPDTLDDHEEPGLRVTGRGGERVLPWRYAHRDTELAYATTVHGVQGETVDTAHVLVGETTGAAAAYVAMTRGRHHNTAHLVADTVDGARAQWIEVFDRDRADLGPEHAASKAAEDVDRYGPQPLRRPTVQPQYQPPRQAESWRAHERNPGYGRSGSGRGPSR